MENKAFTFQVTKEETNTRLDKYLSDKLSENHISRNKIKKTIDERKVFVNDEIKVRANYLVCEGDVVKFEWTAPAPLEVKGEKLDFDIVYEDDDILVINKPNDMVVHPGAGNKDGTLVNGLVEYFKGFKDVGENNRPGLVHRIDKLTTGLLVVAKTEQALNFLQNEIKHHNVKRTYIALVHGYISENTSTINAPIGRHSTDRIKMAVTVRNSKEAITHFKVLKRWTRYTLIECELETGRTHQIRVHLSYIKHPIVGDYVYGKRSESNAYGQYLHAHQLILKHPVTKKMMTFEAPLPKEFDDKIEEITRK